MKDRQGEIHTTNQGYKVKIINYRGALDCDVKFENGFVSLNKTYKNVKVGQIKNPFHPVICNKGYIGVGIYKSKRGNYPSIEYRTWVNMFNRCYSEDIKQSPTCYNGCSVDEKWHNFQVFAEWFNKNYIEGFDMDKDILIKNNKIYSEETCCFVPREINSLLTSSFESKSNTPIGVFERYGKFFSCFSKENKQCWLGTFDNEIDAFNKYKLEKEKYIKEVANKWKGKISERIYKVMIEYKVEITD